MFAIAALGLLLTGISAPKPPPLDRPESAVPAEYAQCAPGLEGSTSNGPARIVRPGPETFCFGGAITPDAMAALAAEIAKVPEGGRLVLVAMSNGGDIYSALEVGALIVRRDVTIVTGPICASSCANYLFLPARRRVVPAGSVVAFHGGLSAGFMKNLRKQLRAESRKRRPDPALVASLEKTIGEATQAAPREQALLRARGVDPDFFAFFDDVPFAAWRRNCPGPPNRDQVFVLSPDALRRSGAPVDLWRGPRSQAELESTLASIGSPVRMCFWP